MTSSYQSPTQRSVRALKAEGYVLVQVVEWRDRFSKLHDLFGIFDIVALRPGETVAVQTTTADNLASRRTKMLESAELGHVLDAGWRVLLHGWRPRGYEGGLPDLIEQEIVTTEVVQLELFEQP